MNLNGIEVKTSPTTLTFVGVDGAGGSSKLSCTITSVTLSLSRFWELVDQRAKLKNTVVPERNNMTAEELSRSMTLDPTARDNVLEDIKASFPVGIIPDITLDADFKYIVTED